jgi:uncharacterized protein
MALIVLCLQPLAAPANATSVSEIPRPTLEEPLRVVDEGEVLSRLTEASLSKASDNLAKQTGFETHFVTIHRLDYGETPESFAQKLLQRWFPEEETQAKQALLVLDTVTNGGSLQMGDAIKASLANDIAQSIVNENLAVPLRQGRYNQGFQDAGDRLVAVLSGKPDPGPPEIVEAPVNVESTFASAEETDTHRSSALLWVVGLLVAATVIPMATYYFYLFLQSRA